MPAGSGSLPTSAPRNLTGQNEELPLARILAARYNVAVAYVIAVAVIVAGVLFASFLVDRRDRHHGRKAHVHMTSWFDRRAQVRRAESLMAYMNDSKGIGSNYSAERLRESDRQRPPSD